MEVKICMCGCGGRVARRFRPGHDAKLKRKLRMAARDKRPILSVPFPTTDPWEIARTLKWLKFLPPKTSRIKEPKTAEEMSILGYGVSLGNDENKFQLRSSFLSEMDNVVLAFVDKCTRYDTVPKLFSIFKGVFVDKAGNQFSKFLDMYGGITIKIPIMKEGMNEEVLRYTHLPDLISFFGENLMVALLDGFVEGEIGVPPSDYLMSSMRDMDILVALQDRDGDRRKVVRLLAHHYHMKPIDVQRIARRIGA